MPSSKIIGAIAAAAALASVPAFAETAKVSETARAWRCDGEACAGPSPGGSEAAVVAQCRKVAKVVGPLASYVSRGYALSDAGLRNCNRPVRPYVTAGR